MKLTTVLTAVAFLLSAAGAGATLYYVYAGEWSGHGGGFDLPFGIEIAPNGDVYVCDQGNYRIQYFSSDGTYKGGWGSQGDGDYEFDTCCDVAIADNGDVYVTEDVNGRVHYFTATGTYIGQWPVPEACGVDIAPDGNVYVTDFEFQRVQYFTPDGTKLGEWGSQGSDPGQFSEPMVLATALNGDVYVPDNDNQRIQYFTSTGGYLGQWPIDGWPVAVDVADDGTVFVSDFGDSEVEIYSATGHPLGSFGKYGTGDGEFRSTAGVAVTPDGSRVYVVDFYGGRVQYFEPGDNTDIVTSSVGRLKALFR
jgi:tripartite motif-containing protein 71